MELVKIQNIATTAQGLQVDLELQELYIGAQQSNITTPWQLVVKDSAGNELRRLTAVGVDAGEAFEAWFNSEAGQAIRAILTQQAQAHLQDPQSAIRRELDFFATVNK